MRCDFFVVALNEVMLREEWRRSAKMKRPASADNSGWVLVIAVILVGEGGGKLSKMRFLCCRRSDAARRVQVQREDEEAGFRR